tara:strand:- start:276343 stop:276567 length:225 start_codon:yes stop_codon:yes gene_type:complete
MAKRSGRKRWEPSSIRIKQEKVSDERFEQLLAEVGEVLYKRLRDKVRVQDEQTTKSSSTEPFLRLGNGEKPKTA